ncbi:MAG: hypothetical protein DME26_00015 [Verrucomicrobia bacterium]|nr:MAG: hypothetical protein DME26_00015 [Verrucomicrobiota bacterium]
MWGQVKGENVLALENFARDTKLAEPIPKQFGLLGFAPLSGGSLDEQLQPLARSPPLEALKEDASQGGVQHQRRLDQQSADQDPADGQADIVSRNRGQFLDKRLHFYDELPNKRFVLSKRLSSLRRRCRRRSRGERNGGKPAQSLVLLFFTLCLQAQEKELVSGAEKFLGAASCSSSSCHGGDATNRNQNLIWSRRDFHTRSYATLTTARSERLAETLKLGEAPKSLRCTVCHAPFHEVAEGRRGAGVRSQESVSCETCHGPAEGWLRTHTRADLTHGERIRTGLRDFKNLYARANTCVPCHQTVENDLLAAGHPELIFELDGQAVAEPKHWREKHEWIGPQAWLVGQAVALREMSWQLSREQTAADRVAPNWSGLLWLLQRIDGEMPGAASLRALSLEPTLENLARAQQLSDELARRTADAFRDSCGLRHEEPAAPNPSAPRRTIGSGPGSAARAVYARPG